MVEAGWGRTGRGDFHPRGGRGQVLFGQNGFEFHFQGDEGEVDIEDEGEEGAEEAEHAGDEGQADEPVQIDLAEGADKERHDEDGGEGGAGGGEDDALADDAGAPVEDFDLGLGLDEFVAGAAIQLVLELAGAVNGPTKAVGHGEEEEADTRDDDDGADGIAELRYDLFDGRGQGQHGDTMKEMGRVGKPVQNDLRFNGL